MLTLFINIVLAIGVFGFAMAFAWVFPKAFLRDRHGCPYIVGVIPWCAWFGMSVLSALAPFGTALLLQNMWAVMLSAEMRF